MPISRSTRSRIIDVLTAEHIHWYGNLSSVDFLRRLFDLEALPSKDPRFQSAYRDIETHSVTFADWDDNWVFFDDRFDLLSCGDETFLQFLCAMVSPGVRTDRAEIDHLIDIFNDSLISDGWSIAEEMKVAGRPFFTYRAVHDSTQQVAVTSTGQRVALPAGFHHLADYYAHFLADHPDPSNNVFLIMRFRDTDQHRRIHAAIRDQLNIYGLHVLRADDKDYTQELWTNICLYMLGSNFGIAVFEEIEERESNPNIALELGFMLASNKRCLILKEQHMPKMPSDIIGRLYKPFDVYQIEDSIRQAVSKWIIDLGLPAF
jgi:hypothetical protein